MKKPLIAAALFLSACNNTPAPSSAPSAFAQATEITPNPGWIEVSAGAIAPPSKTGGELWVFGSFGVAGTSITTGQALPDPSLPNNGPSTCATLDAKLPCFGHWGNDQQTVQLANGDYLLSWNGYTAQNQSLYASRPWYNDWQTSTASPSPWTEYNITGVNCGGMGNNCTYPRQGIRPAQLLFRYSAQALSISWAGALDTAAAGGVDPKGALQDDYCAQSPPWNGGTDRPELYADPWHASLGIQRLYIASDCWRNLTGGAVDRSRQIWFSNDGGATWRTTGNRLPNSNSDVTAIATTPSGRLFALQLAGASGSQPVAYYSGTDGYTFVRNSSQAFDMIDLTSGGQLPEGAPNFPSDAPFKTNLNSLALAPNGPSSVLAVYPAWETANTPGHARTSGGVGPRQIAEVVIVWVDEAGPHTGPIATIRAASESGSILMPSFITDYRAVGNPVTMLYWMETNPTDTPPSAKARYALFLGAGSFPAPTRDLGSGFATPSSGTPAIGDYMKGASYITSGAGGVTYVNFAPVWPQWDQPGNTFHPYTRVIPVQVNGSSVKPYVLSTNKKPAVRATFPLHTGASACDKCPERERSEPDRSPGR